MPRKRIRSKIKNTINLKSLTFDLYESACEYKSMGDVWRKYKAGKWKNWKAGFDDLNGWLFDKNDPKACKEIWERHGEAIMARWKADINNAGKMPWLFHEIQEIEKLENSKGGS